MSAIHSDEIKRKYNFKQISVATWRDPRGSVLPARGGPKTPSISADDAAAPYVPSYKVNYNLRPLEQTDSEDSEEGDHENDVAQTNQDNHPEPADSPVEPHPSEIPPAVAGSSNPHENVTEIASPAENHGEPPLVAKDVVEVIEVPDPAGQTSTENNEEEVDEVPEVVPPPPVPSTSPPVTSIDHTVVMQDEGESEPPVGKLTSAQEPLDEELLQPEQLRESHIAESVHSIENSVAGNGPSMAVEDDLIDVEGHVEERDENIDKKVTFAPGTPEPKARRKKSAKGSKGRSKKRIAVPLDSLPPDIVAIVDCALNGPGPPPPPPPVEAEQATLHTGNSSDDPSNDSVADEQSSDDIGQAGVPEKILPLQTPTCNDEMSQLQDENLLKHITNNPIAPFVSEQPDDASIESLALPPPPPPVDQLPSDEAKRRSNGKTSSKDKARKKKSSGLSKRRDSDSAEPSIDIPVQQTVESKDVVVEALHPPPPPFAPSPPPLFSEILAEDVDVRPILDELAPCRDVSQSDRLEPEDDLLHIVESEDPTVMNDKNAAQDEHQAEIDKDEDTQRDERGPAETCQLPDADEQRVGGASEVTGSDAAPEFGVADPLVDACPEAGIDHAVTNAAEERGEEGHSDTAKQSEDSGDELEDREEAEKAVDSNVDDNAVGSSSPQSAAKEQGHLLPNEADLAGAQQGGAEMATDVAADTDSANQGAEAVAAEFTANSGFAVEDNAIANVGSEVESRTDEATAMLDEVAEVDAGAAADPRDEMMANMKVVTDGELIQEADDTSADTGPESAAAPGETSAGIIVETDSIPDDDTLSPAQPGAKSEQVDEFRNSENAPGAHEQAAGEADQAGEVDLPSTEPVSIVEDAHVKSTENFEGTPQAPPSPTLSKGSAHKIRPDHWERNPSRKHASKEGKAEKTSSAKRNSRDVSDRPGSSKGSQGSRRKSMTAEDEAERRKRRDGRRALEAARIMAEERRKADEEELRRIRHEARRAARKAAAEEAARLAKAEAEAIAREEAEVRRKRREELDKDRYKLQERSKRERRESITKAPLFFRTNTAPSVSSKDQVSSRSSRIEGGNRAKRRLSPRQPTQTDASMAQQMDAVPAEKRAPSASSGSRPHRRRRETTEGERPKDSRYEAEHPKSSRRHSEHKGKRPVIEERPRSLFGGLLKGF